MTRIRQWSTLVVCALFLFGLPLWHLLAPDEEFSKSERRRLEHLPELTLSGVVDGEYFEEMEDYLLDQFPERDAFRSAKSLFSFSVLRQKDVGGFYHEDGHLGKLEAALDEAQFSYGIRKLNEVRETLPESCAVYYAVIPDKNVYLAQPNGYPHIDYDDMLRRLRDGLQDMTEIPLFDLLDASDYYRTDAHWRQEALEPVVSRITQAMGVPTPDWSSWQPQELYPFQGVYLGQSALPVEPDTLVYLQNDVTDAAQVSSLETSGGNTVYTPDRFSGMDGYDTFLSGAQALLTVENPLAGTDRRLILFRDSFGSSLAPLLLDSYREITLVDLRYLSSSLLGDYVDFDGADVLFLYSTSILNSAMLLK